MPLAALALILLAGCLHAAWNLALKKANAPGAAFLWCCSATAFVVYSPFVISLYGAEIRGITRAQIIAVVAGGVLQTLYFYTLQRGYAAADLSIVYPVARGVGPLLSAIVAMAALDESPSLLSIAGLALIVAGTFTIAGGWALLRGGWSKKTRGGLGWGALTGVFIAGYTVNDGRAVRFLAMTPFVLEWLGEGFRALLLTPAVVTRRAETREVLRRAFKHMLAVALVAPLAYVLVLQAMRLAPISRVAPARELSMLVAAFLGVRVLNEGEMKRRVAGAALIASGVISLGLAR